MCIFGSLEVLKKLKIEKHKTPDHNVDPSKRLRNQCLQPARFGLSGSIHGVCHSILFCPPLSPLSAAMVPDRIWKEVDEVTLPNL